MKYPTVAEVQSADTKTLCSWVEHLPAPQTDVEHTVHRRIRRAIDATIASESPVVFEGIQKLRDALERAGVKIPDNYFTKRSK